MSIKPTILGAVAPQTGSKLAPTRMGGLGAGGSAPSPAQPEQSSMRPTAFKPTSMPAPAPVQPTVAARPTAMPFRAPEPAPAVAEPLRASALPGTQRKPLDVSHAQLELRFPGTAPELLERVRAILAGVTPQAPGAMAWLNFGVPAQEAVSAVVKERMAVMETAPTRDVSQHLARLQLLLGEVLDAMDGGFFKKPAATVWASVVGEIRQLEALLSNAGTGLTGMLTKLGELSGKAQECGEVVQANALAAEYLADVVAQESVHLLVTRATSLTASQALLLEQLQMLTLDATQIQELTTLVQNGVLLQLPAVYSQLAGLSTKPSDTERYLATEKLNEIVNFMKRKPQWP